MKIGAAAIQMEPQPFAVAANLERADALVRQARDSGAEVVALPEMVNTGYAFSHHYADYAEGLDGPTIQHWRGRSIDWDIAIAAGFVERDGRHLYDSLALFTPDGQVRVYRKRNLVFWERFSFRPGREPLVVQTKWGRIGLAICADMIYKQVWDDYRGRIDMAVVSSAWPDFACRLTGRKHWLLGKIGPLSGSIPRTVANDLGVPVIFANQCGPTHTSIPMVGTWLIEKLADRFAGLSCVCDGRHGPPTIAGREEEVIVAPITLHSFRGPRSCRTTSPWATASASYSVSARP